MLGELSKISKSDKDILRDNILVFVAQLPPLLRYISANTNFSVVFLLLKTGDTLLHEMNTL